MKTKISWIITLLVFLIILATTYYWGFKYYLLASIILIVVTMLPFYWRFEHKPSNASQIVLLANLIAIAAVSRVPFAAIPSVQPTSFVIIMTGLALGGEAGFLVGSLAALVSNIFLGQGPWTPWQMFSWGMMGLTAGLLRNSWFLATNAGRVVFGLAWGMIFGWIMNLWYVFNLGQGFSWAGYLLACVASFPMDLSHGIANMLLLTLFYDPFMKILNRIIRKYDLGE